jgi:Ca2+-transporting ATPase
MLTVHHTADGGTMAICKGAPESLLHAGVLLDEPADIDAALQLSRSMAATGARVIAVAQRRWTTQETRPSESGLTLLGLAQLHDPIRPASAATVASCHQAGIDVALVTGDHPATAKNVADQVGIAAGAEHVVARATPAEKLVLIQSWQEAGHVVAMTGDGVNDGPALRRADIGVAMGERGTEVARQSADLILSDDDLGTVVAAVEEGRRVYANIRRFLLYALSGGASEILLMLAGPALGTPLPLLPAQILWLNLLTHSFVGAALGTEAVEIGTMTRPPRDPLEGVLGGGLWWRITTIAAVLGAASLSVSLVAGSRLGSSAALLTLGAGQLGVAWGVRARTHKSGTTWMSAPMPLALVGATLLLVSSVTIPPLRSLLSTELLPATIWGLAVVSALIGYLCARVLRPRNF